MAQPCQPQRPLYPARRLLQSRQLQRPSRSPHPPQPPGPRTSRRMETHSQARVRHPRRETSSRLVRRSSHAHEPQPRARAGHLRPQQRPRHRHHRHTPSRRSRSRHRRPRALRRTQQHRKGRDHNLVPRLPHLDDHLSKRHRRARRKEQPRNLLAPTGRRVRPPHRQHRHNAVRARPLPHRHRPHVRSRPTAASLSSSRAPNPTATHSSTSTLSPPPARSYPAPPKTSGPSKHPTAAECAKPSPSCRPLFATSEHGPTPTT